MKKCIACIVLLSLALAACTAVTQSPTSTTTEPQMNGTTTTATTLSSITDGTTTEQTTTAPTTVTTTAPTTVTTTATTTLAVPTTVTITGTTTVTTTTVTTVPATTTQHTTTTSTVNQAVGVVQIVVGDKSILPVGGMQTKKTYNNGKWPTTIASPFIFTRYDDSQIPAIQLTDTLQIRLAEGVELNSLGMQTSREGNSTRITLEEIPELSPGVYYIRMNLTKKGDYIDGQWETTTYQFGFKLVVPGP